MIVIRLFMPLSLMLQMTAAAPGLFVPLLVPLTGMRYKV